MITGKPFSIIQPEMLPNGKIRFTLGIHTSVGLIFIRGWRYVPENRLKVPPRSVLIPPHQGKYYPMIGPLPKAAKVLLERLCAKIHPTSIPWLEDKHEDSLPEAAEGQARDVQVQSLSE